MIAVTLNGVGMNTNNPDVDGALWYVTDMQGWDSPEIRQNRLDPDLVDGTKITQSRWGARVVSLTGVCKTTSETDFWIAYNKITVLATPFADVTLAVFEGNTAKMLDVRLATPAKIAIRGGLAFDWSLTLIAENPHKY